MAPTESDLLSLAPNTDVAPTIFCVVRSPEFANSQEEMMYAGFDEAERDLEYDGIESVYASSTSRATTGWMFVMQNMQPTKRIAMLWSQGARPSGDNGVLLFSRAGNPDVSTCSLDGNFPVKSKLNAEDIRWIRAFFNALMSMC